MAHRLMLALLLAVLLAGSCGVSITGSGKAASEFECASSVGCPELSIRWGEIVLTDPATNASKTFRDAKIWPGGARAWDWRETGTHHRPGTQLADVQELVALNPEVVVVSLGMKGNLHVAPDLQHAMKTARSNSGIRWLELKSDEAAETYNDLLRSGKRVAAIIHSTC
mmetsp:Transcript_131371/g.366264  ORF Transcript_131371/g.366264 Transcript_131371/m.366264 type:complete len:168 (-) Transcript_131371:169-672(-)